jgi:hypothetical protein
MIVKCARAIFSRPGILRAAIECMETAMNRARSCVIFLSGIVLALSGYAWASPPAVSAEPGTGLAFGAFDITASDLAVTHAVLMRIKPARMYMGSSGEKATITYTNGEFFSPNLAPGTYSVIGFFSGSKFFALERGLRENTFTVEAGRVAYAGSYKLELKKGGLFRNDKGTFSRIDNPQAERQLLEWLAKELAASSWAPMVDARLAENNN